MRISPMTKNIRLSVFKVSLLLLLLSWQSFVLAQKTTPLEDYLSSIKGATVTPLKCDTFFTEKYEVMIDQLVDHKDSSIGTFRQRFIVCHKDVEAPVVFTTEGYNADYATRPRYINELTPYLGANEIIVEHRYFAKSVPHPLDWQYLTVENAAGDHHHIIELMKPFYKGKWISTGISKGGQTALYHRYFFPDDVDVTVGYVCPLNFSTEDLRVYDFLEHVGDSACRAKIYNYQLTMLKREDECLPEFQRLAEKEHQHYKYGYQWGYELTVMEYSFAFWQWGYYSCDRIPDSTASAEYLVSHLDKVAGLDWISEEGIAANQPFFYQALTEIGMYGYDISRFKPYIHLKSGTFEFVCPDGYSCNYNPIPMQEVDCFVRHRAKKMIFIYGGTDPWGSTGVQWSGSPEVLKIVKPGGSHRTRINNLPEDQKEEVLDSLQNWLGMPLVRD
jgi:hypothetical protein